MPTEGSVFPFPSEEKRPNLRDILSGKSFSTPHEGLSLRDWFAGLAMQAVINGNLQTCEQIASESCRQADAMLKARCE